MRKTLKRKAGGELLESTSNHVQFRNTAVKRIHYTTTDHSGSSTSSTVVGRVPVAVASHIASSRQHQNQPENNPISPLASDSKKRTQNGELLDDFGEHFDALGALLLESEADEETALTCACGSGLKRTTKCYDCTEYAAACKQCFVRAHLHNPFHWAEVWDDQAGFFIRYDISKLDHVIQIGHNGMPCKSPVGERLVTVVHGNGVHSTRLSFCGCQEMPPHKIRQLMRARLFPATTKDPHTVFTVSVLKEFQLHNLESKKAAYDYLGALRRLSDNAFTADIPNPYSAFLRVVRVFNFLTLKKRTGQFHGIDTILRHRPRGNLLVWCPACPEPGFNSDPNCPSTPAHLSHLNQSQRTLDGNHQCNQFSKNTDPDDVSLCAGNAYFPLDSIYQDYLKSVKTSTEVVNKQDKKKFKNMAITGTVNCQCSHVFILSSVDLPHAERFANADYALALAIRNHNPVDDFTFKLQLEIDDVDEAATYDIACAYVVNLETRFKDHFPNLLERVAKIRWGIPALHIQGHQDSCTYLFGTAYMECVGHFHGETAEHYWPEANQLGPHVRQMNLGHRQDTIINHHTSDLAEDLQAAKKKYLEKRDHYIGLSISFKDRVAEWEKMDRKSYKDGKEAFSVADNVLVPSQLAIYQRMVTEDDNFAFTMIPKSKIAAFLDRGLHIQVAQRKLKQLIKDTTEHDLQVWRKEISTQTTKLKGQILTFRSDQKHFMASVADKVASHTALGPAIEDEKLFLPSDLTEMERGKMDLVALGLEESRWREGQAFDVLQALQHIVKSIGALRNRKIKQERQQKQNSRAGDQIAEALKRQNHHIESYNSARLALISLNGSTKFPPLTEADLFMKSVQQKRQVGDSKRTDGLLWRAKALADGAADEQGDADDTLPGINDNDDGANISGTQMSRRKPKRGSKQEPEVSSKVPKDQSEGWLWQLGKLTKMTTAEMDAWANEGKPTSIGDRVQWFRAEAEMQRWQEQWEQKLVELLRTRRSFTKMESVWQDLAKLQPPDSHGMVAYAQQKAAMYAWRKQEAGRKIQEVGYAELLGDKANVVALIESERSKAQNFIESRICTRTFTFGMLDERRPNLEGVESIAPISDTLWTEYYKSKSKFESEDKQVNAVPFDRQLEGSAIQFAT
ncbi:hypothetical protein C8R45DRAFT_935329 [Mycena sanguinolenta]|nr:hypothetical protein C8R45DRAFT_935329 [Mycena sanguinolenta]